ncbi:MAG: tail fiber domain-containing protein [Chthoniobacterales bacterium]|nr:tail fiber domain-containing protein [Chthoniobacterales bacterium]
MPLALRLTTLVFLLAATDLLLLPVARAVSPPPDGGYANANTAEGTDALLNLGVGANNTAIGFTAMQYNSSGDYNTATGAKALLSNINGSGNTAQGYNALSANTIGLANTAAGKDSLSSNTTGSVNTATGNVALLNNTNGSANTATGANALAGNTSASNNTADGFAALTNNRTGANNTASGTSALANNTTGSNNIALGYFAGSNLTTGDDNIDIGNPGAPREAGTIRIGTRGTHNTTYIAGIFGSTVSNGATVMVDNKGRLGTVTSSARYKERIEPMNQASESLFSLQPVTFRYRKELDPERLPQFGLVAEQVAKVNPALVARDEDGQPYTVRYEAVNAMLLNEFLKEHRKVEALETKVAQQEKAFRSEIGELQSALKAQSAQIQQVNEKLQASKAPPLFTSSE